MPANQLSHIIVFVSDMKRSVQFYSDVLGLSLRFQSPHWTEFDAAGVVLALHLADGTVGEQSAHGGTSAGRCRLGLSVANIDEFHGRMVERGVVCIQPPKLEKFGAKLALYADPDGLPFSVGEETNKTSWDQPK